MNLKSELQNALTEDLITHPFNFLLQRACFVMVVSNRKTCGPLF